MDLLHDFVGLCVRVGGREKLIKAEKFTRKIEIPKVESLETNGAEIKHGPVGVEDCGEIGMGDLLAILKEHSPDYSLVSDNCWKYADSTFRRLIRNFSAHSTISPERRSELEGFNHPAPTMPDNVIFSCASALVGGAGTQAGLAVVASIGATVLGASAFAVNLFPPEQLAQLFVSLKSATVQNFLHSTSATHAQGGMHTIATVQAPAPALSQILSAPQTMQAIAAAQSQAQTMLPALSPHLSRMLLLSQKVKSRRSLPLNLSLSVKPWLLQPATFSGLSRSLLESLLLCMFSSNSGNWCWPIGGNDYDFRPIVTE
jgi:hypothetical protein